MGYIIRKEKKSWRVVYRSYEGGKDRERKIDPGSPEYESLGLSPLLSLEEASTRIKLLQQETELQRIAKKRDKATKHRKELDLIESTYLPRPWVKEFEDGYLKLLGARKDRWLIVKELISKLDIPPEKWHFQPEKIYHFFIERADSLDYARRLLKLINKWGAFYSLKAGRPFLPIDAPSGAVRRSIRAAYYKRKPDRSTNIITPSDPILSQPDMKLMFWFGLRPREFRMLLKGPDATKWRIQTDDPRFKYVLHVFQEKLLDAGIEPRLCWKAIPAVEPEQIECIASLLAPTALVARPFATLGSGAPTSFPKGITERSLRKSFVAVMQKRGYSDSCISRWLGHIGDSTKQRHYETKELAFFEPPFRKAS